MSNSRPDILAKTALERGDITVDQVTGVITRRNGERAEVLDKRLGYGRVAVYRRPLTWAMAHRVVWISAHGLIPPGLHVNHINRRRWDNRLDNLELVTPKGNVRHAIGHGGYDRIGEGAGAVSIDWLHRLDKGEAVERDINPYHIHPMADWSKFR